MRRAGLGARRRYGGVVFFVTDDALRRITPNMQFDESGIQRTFDLNRNLIYAIAAKVYRRGRKGSYELVAADF